MSNNSNVYREAYNKGKEIVPDFVYDQMFSPEEAELDDIGQGELIDHAHPMLSLPTFFLDLDKINADILAASGVINRGQNIELSYKLDGVPGSCILGPNGWIRSVSRGKRFKGFVMNKAFVQILPKPKQLPDHEIDFRGEYVISYADFERLNAALPEHERYANPRSMVSSQINSIKPNDDIVKCIKWFAHAIWDGNKPAEHFLELLKWFDDDDIAPNFPMGNRGFWNDLHYNINHVYNSAMNFKYPCDGIVIRHSTTTNHDGRCNLDRIAIKQFDESSFSAQTTVDRIEWRLANNGSYFPRLWFKPVNINGSEVTHAAAYCWDYLNRLGLSIGASVVVTMRGGVIPYVSKVLHIGNGDYQFPADAAQPEPGDMQLWSTQSDDAVQRLKFIRGMTMLDLKDCGVALFSDMYDAGIVNLFQVADLVQNKFLYSHLVHCGVLPETEASIAKCNTINERFNTFNYVWLILALRENNIGFNAANAIGQHLSGYTLANPRELNKKAVQAFLANTELIEQVKQYARPVAPEHANLSVGFNTAPVSNKPKACMSKKPSNGMKKQDFAATYLQDYDITDNIKEASLLICPAGENSNKIKFAQANNIEIKHYEDFL